ncbi:MAG: hypothetical protein MZW92_12995 [Comamonadaceae bacterium]|nr:hypothetical protein [Comamonadaceae bacterium]
MPALLALDFQQRAERLKALAKYPDRTQGAALRHLGPHRRHAQRRLDRHRGRHRHAVRLRRRRRQRAALGQPGARRPGAAAGQEGRLRRHAHPGAAAAAWRCTSTPSTSRSGGCWRSSRPASWPACPASPSRPPPRATSPRPACG